MAAGRHGGYLDRDFRHRGPDIEVSSRKDLSKDKIREGDRRKGSDPLDCGHMVKDTKGRDVVKDSRSSSSSTGNSSGGSGGKARYTREQHGGFVDREPGELSSGSSGSEDHDAPQSKMLENDGVHLETGISASPPLKRKFSPIIWDEDVNKKPTVVTLTGENNSSLSVPFPPPPPLPEGFVTSCSVNSVSSLGNLSGTDDKSLLAVDNHQHLSNGQETGQLDEEDEYVPARNISSSRWADVDDLEDDEIKHSKVESGSVRRKGTPNSGVLHKKVPTPEFGEVDIREGSNIAASGPSDSEYEDEFEENGIIGRDYMDVDGDDFEKDTAYQSDKEIEEEDNTNKTPERVQPPQRSINMLQSCRSVDEFERLNKIDEGTYGVVYRAKDKKTGEVVALKKVKMEKEREGFPLTSLREINILLSFHHPSIVDVKEVVVGSSLDSIFMVMEYMDHDLKGLMETVKQPFSQSEVKCLMLQLLEGVKYLHDNWVLHRDLKTSNLLFNNRGELKICDFGLSRQYGSPLKPYTHLVVTLWYRPPELLLGIKEYSTVIDMWSLGCIMAELLAKEPLFNGKTEFDQLDKIFRILGTPNETIWPGFTKLPGVKVNFVKQPYNRLREKFPPTSFSGRPTLSEKGFDLLNKLLTYDPEKRITAEQALNHEWFKEVPLPKSKDFMPTFPAQHAQDRRLRRILKSPDPLEEQRQRELQQGGIALGSLFN